MTIQRIVRVLLVVFAIALMVACAAPPTPVPPTAVPPTVAPTVAPTAVPATKAPASSSSSSVASSASSSSVAATTAPTTAPTSAPTAAPTQAARTAPTDSLTIALSTLEAETFLPWNGGGGRSPYLTLLYDALVYMNPKTEEPGPGLASKWEMSPDGKVWTFYIRQGVQFSEGYGEVTAADVAYSIERIKDPKAIAGPSSQLRALIAKVETPETYKVVVTLNSAYAELERALSDGNQLLIVSKKYVESVGDDKANAHPIGSSPYTLAEEHKKGGSIKLTTVPGVEKHWRVTPEFKNVTFVGIPEEATRVAMLKNGEADMAPISLDSVDTIKASGLRTISVKSTWAPVIRMGGLIETDPKRFDANNPWSKLEVRQALNYAVDKDTIAKSIFRGEATPAGTSIPFNIWLDVKPYPYDPAKAKQLLASAGYPNGFSVTLKTFTTAPGAELPVLGEAVAQYWKAIGVNVTIVPTDWGTVRGEWTNGKANNYVWAHRGFAFPDFVTGLSASYQTQQVFATFTNKDTDAWLTRAAAEFDTAKRAQIVKDFGQVVHDQATDVFMVFANEVYGVSKKIGEWPTLRVRPENIEYITHPK